MTFKELQTAMMNAMKEKNKVKKEVIADIVATAKNMAIAKGCKDNITDEIVDTAILKAKKTCQEQIDTCPADRTCLLETYNIHMTYIDELAPKMMTREEVSNIVVGELMDLIALEGVELDKKYKGKVMKAVMPILKGKADGKLINEVVDFYLS